MKNKLLAFVLSLVFVASVIPMAAVATPLYVQDHKDYMTQNSFFDNLPIVDEEKNTVTFQNGWEIGYYDINKKEFHAFSNVVDKQYKMIAAEGVTYVWTGGGGMYYNNGTIAIDRGNATTKFNTVRYTAPTGGKIAYTLATFNLFRNGGTGTFANTFNFSLYQNGKKIWPKDADYFVYENTTDATGTTKDVVADFVAKADFPLEIEVEAGDVIDFRVGYVNQHTVQIGPAVTYTALMDAPAVEGAHIDFSKSMGCYIDVTLDVEKSRKGAKLGALCWTEERAEYDPDDAIDLASVSSEEGKATFVYSGLSIKQMTDTLFIQPYTKVEGNDAIHYGQVYPVSVGACLQDAYENSTDAAEKKALSAFVNMGASAQQAFSYRTDSPANSFLNEDARFPSGRFGTDRMAQSNDGTTGVNITKASLVLDNRIGLKLTAPRVSGVSEYVLEVATRADFSDAKEIVMTADGTVCFGIYYMDFDALDATVYARVKSNGAYGNTLTYSVESYIARISLEPIRDSMYILVASVYDFVAAVGELSR